MSEGKTNFGILSDPYWHSLASVSLIYSLENLSINFYLYWVKFILDGPPSSEGVASISMNYYKNYLINLSWAP